MSNYDMDEIEREVSNAPATKPQNNLPEYPARKGKRLEDAIIKHVSPNQSHIINGIKQWDAQTQSYITFSNDQDNIKDTLRNAPRLKAHTTGYEDEEVTTPKHYVGLGITPLEYITANELDFIEGNIIKYVTRYPHKGGVNDLLKARTYLEKLIEREVEKT